MIGQTLGHYRVLELLGKGGMGEVYLAEDLTLHRNVALKVLPTELASIQERLERFRREAESLAALNHPNIVHIYTVEEHDGVHFLTMELVEGERLSEIIERDGLPLDQFFNLAIPLADALSEAHEAGVVHRDLKPANVMVDRRGRPKILDFGLAKLRLPESSAEFSELPTEVMTEEGKVLGTYPYMSPEQVEGKSVDHRSDIFSVGTMLYEMATGHRPFQGDSPASMMSAILRDSPSAVDAEREELPHHLGRIVSRCLEKDTEDRYQRARDLTKDLDELRQEVQTGVRSASRPPGIQAAGGSRVRSLAVLPLENLSGDLELDYYAAGITEGLIGELGRVGAWRVISRRSVMRYLDSDMPLPQIAAELGVEALIEGSVLPAGERVRVAAQLVQADPEQQLWADTYERDSKDILTLLREVTGAIAREVQVAVSPQELARQATAREVDPEAHRAYLKALQASTPGTPEASKQAVEFLREAVAIDPEFAEAWVEMASHYAMLAFLHLPANMEVERATAIEEMNVALERAFELDDSSSLAHCVQGIIHAHLDWDWERAESALLRGIELGPSSPEAHGFYAEFLAAMGRSEEAFSEAALAEELDPFSPDFLRVVGQVHYWAQDFETALQYIEKALELAPGNIHSIALKGWLLGAVGMEQEAVQAWQQMQGQLGNYFLAAAYESRSLDEVTRAWLDFVVSMDRPYFGAADIATVYGMLGEADEAMEWLEKGYATRGDPGKTAGWRFIYMKVDPNLDGLHSDPRFQDLLRRMNFPD